MATTPVDDAERSCAAGVVREGRGALRRSWDGLRRMTGERDLPGTTHDLTFPDLPRLELDQLLEQLVERAQEVIGTQGRLRGLLHANRLIIQDLALPVVLRHIVDAARELLGARYAALGVIGPDGTGLAQFVHAGMTDEQVATIGDLPQGKGLLGALIDNPCPIRLDRIAEDCRSSGFPAGHPPMDSFLGVPIRIRDEVFGNLYLAEARQGRFSAEDAALAQALAATAAVAIDNARLYTAARARQDWLRASTQITRELLDGDHGRAEALQLIAATSREIAAADLVVVTCPVEDGTRMRVEIAEGPGASELIGLTLATEQSLTGQVLATGRPRRDPNAADHPGFAAAAGHIGLQVGPALLLPLRGTRDVYGVLAMARARTQAPFTEVELEMAAGFTNQAALALELARTRAEQHRDAMHDERDRIAADLHDHVIQRLFATGLCLQRVAAGLPADDRGAARVTAAVGELDATISQIRSTVFALQHLTTPDDGGLRGRILDVLAEAAPALGFDPALRLVGPVEHVVPATIAEDLLAVLREALTNTARHAGATAVEVTLTTDPTGVALQVTDNGRGLDPTTRRRSGLANLRRRAEHHGGTLTIDTARTTSRGSGPTAAEPTGARLTWSVPLAP
jgi:signal transduction histidine kinase